MQSGPERTSSIVFDIVDMFERDRRAGSLLGLAHYLARFPGHEETVAREYLRFSDSPSPAPAAVPPRLDPRKADPARPQVSSETDFLKRSSETPFAELLRQLAAPILRGKRFQREGSSRVAGWASSIA